VNRRSALRAIAGAALAVALPLPAALGSRRPLEIALRYDKARRTIVRAPPGVLRVVAVDPVARVLTVDSRPPKPGELLLDRVPTSMAWRVGIWTGMEDAAVEWFPTGDLEKRRGPWGLLDSAGDYLPPVFVR
jgi:hypothetical protein